MDRNTVLGAALVLAGLIFVVWIKFVRPIRGDIEWKRQGERVEEAKRRRLARRPPA